MRSSSDFGNLGRGIYWGLFPYVGWHALNSIASEMKNPVRDLPKALLISIYTLSFLYLTLTVPIYLITPKDEILSNDGYNFDFAKEIFGTAAFPIIMFSVICSIFSSVNGSMIVLSRMIVCAAEDQQLPLFYSMLQQKRKTPIPAVMLNAFLLMFFLSFPYRDNILNYLSFIQLVGTAMTCFCVLVLRKTKPEWDRPTRISLFFPILDVILTLVVVAFAMQDSYEDFGISVLILF